MGVLDFFFGRTKPTPTTTTTVQSSKLPEEIAPYVKDVLAEAQRLYDEGKERGYEEYPGMTIAPRTPAEEEAIAGLRGLIGTQDTYLQEAESALRGIPQEFTTEQAEKFMSPYQQAVIDIEKRKAEEDFQRKVMPEFERQAVQAGGMSGLGSRAGVQAARLGEAFSQQLGDIQSKGQQKAYEDAYRRFQDQMAMDRARAADLQGIGLTKFQTGIAEQGLAQQLAQADRQEMQATLDEQYAKYLEREQYPKQELAQLSSFVYGNPFLRTPDTTTTAQGILQPNAPGIGQQLLGLGLSGLNIFGMGGGFDGGFSARRVFQGPGGTTRSALKTGGRIVYKQEGGELPNVYSQNQVTARPVGRGLGGFFGDVFNRYPRSNPRSNVIENIDNAAGSLSNYKEIMDENMENLRRASAGISRTYNETFGPMSGRGLGTLTPFVNRAMAQNPGFEQRVNTYGMKDGGGLGSLPVVKRQVGSRVAPSGRLTQRQVEYLRSLRPANTDIRIRNLLRDSQGRLPSYKQTDSTYAQRYKEAFSPPLTASQLLGVEPVWPLPENEMEKLQYDMANYPGQDDSLAKILRGNPLVEAAVQRRTPVPLQKKPTGLSGLIDSDAGQAGPIPKSIFTVDDAVELLREKGSQSISAADDQRAAELDAIDASLSVNIPKAPEPTSPIVGKSLKGGISLSDRLNQASDTMFNAYDSAMKSDDQLEKMLVDSPEKLKELMENKIKIQAEGNEKILNAQAEFIKVQDLIDADFDKQDQDALNKYEERKMKRFEEKAKAWPGAEFAAAIDAGMDEPSLVTMLTKVMNVGAAGVSKRVEKINDELDKFRDAMEEKNEALRTKKKASAISKATRKAELASDRILKESGIDIATADMPIEILKQQLANTDRISKIKAGKFTKAATMLKTLTDLFGETTSGSGVGLGAAGLDLTDPTNSAKNLADLEIVPPGSVYNSQRRVVSQLAIRLLNEGKRNGEIPITKNKEQAKRYEKLFLERPEIKAMLRKAAEEAGVKKTITPTRPGSESKELINKNIRNLAQSPTAP